MLIHLFDYAFGVGLEILIALSHFLSLDIFHFESATQSPLANNTMTLDMCLTKFESEPASSLANTTTLMYILGKNHKYFHLFMSCE